MGRPLGEVRTETRRTGSQPQNAGEVLERDNKGKGPEASESWNAGGNWTKDRVAGSL